MDGRSPAAGGDMPEESSGKLKTSQITTCFFTQNIPAKYERNTLPPPRFARLSTQ